MRGDSVYIIYRYRDLGFLDLFTYMSSCSTFRFRRTLTGSYRETASPMLNFPASHSVWQFLETARPTLNLPVRTDGPTTFSTSVKKEGVGLRLLCIGSLVVDLTISALAIFVEQ